MPRARTQPVAVDPEDLAELLGPERFFLEHAASSCSSPASRPAWPGPRPAATCFTSRRACCPAVAGLRLTGQLGDVMRESARAAQSYVWSHAEELGIDSGAVPAGGVHIHVPAGAVPKDGPSAGVTMATALASLYTRLPVRSDTAMTGEITLTGLVLPVGGIKEKVLAAHRAGIRRVIIPKDNEKDLRELPGIRPQRDEFTLAERIETGSQGGHSELAPAPVRNDSGIGVNSFTSRHR